MAKAETQYERFARAQKFHGVASLWFADDHVLLVDKALVTETYKRYYYGDIQAVIIRPTAGAIVWGIVLAVALGVLMLLAVGRGSPWLSILAALTGAALAWHIIRGQSCDCYIVTAVSVWLLPALPRVKRARRFVEAISPDIAGIQGTLPPEELIARARNLEAMPPPTPPAAAPPLQAAAGAQNNSPAAQAPTGSAAPPMIGRVDGTYGGQWHLMLFASLVIGAGVSMLGSFVSWGIALASIIALVHASLAIVAAIKQRGGPIPRGMRLVVWLTLGYVALVYMMMVMTPTLNAVMYLSSEPDILATDLWRWHFVQCAIMAVASCALGLAGLILWMSFARGTSARQAGSAPAATNG